MKFQNKVGIITGSSQGIGKATAIELCQQGARIILNGRNLGRLEKAESELTDMGFEVLAVQGDVTSVVDCEHLVTEAIRHFGRLDFLVNNGSLTMNESFEEIGPALFQDVVVSNSLGATFPTMAALPHLKKTGGSVVFISSLAGLHGMPTASAYSLGKMALTALWQSLRIELASSGVHFGICYLGFTENDSEKRMLGANGKLMPVPKRPSFIQKSQQEVAGIIARVIHRRKAKTVLSTLGKASNFMMRYFPRLTLFVMISAQKRRNKTTQKEK